MKLTHKNLKKVFDYIDSQIEDENGRGEFDKETPILSAVERRSGIYRHALCGKTSNVKFRKRTISYKNRS